MAYVAVTNVDLKGRERTEADTFLRDVLIPRMTAQPGFQNARFGRSLDGTQGIGAVVFDTESNAKAGLDAMATNRPSDAPPVVSTTIYELIAEA